MTVEPERIAHLVQSEFLKLPAKRKPAIRGNGLHEWVPLSGIVAQDSDGQLYCLSLATGMKCLPASKLPLAHGNVIHDWHAEVLAIRAFNRFVLDECKQLAADPNFSSPFLRLREVAETNNPAGNAIQWYGQPYTWREDVALHMYCSEAPCGDASMELTMAAQDDASPWDLPTAATTEVTTESSAVDLPGRGFFSQLGVVRRKPARGDAPLTLSKSCSDKLSLKQCTSVLNSITSLFVEPQHVYFSTIVVPESQFSPTGCARAFSADKEHNGRMIPLLSCPLSSPAGVSGDCGSGSYHFHPFQVLTVPADSGDAAEFYYSKRSVTSRATAAASAAGSPPKIATSNLAVAWTRSGLEEATLGGVLQGRKQFDARGASFTSRRKMWSLALEVASLLPSPSSLSHLTGFSGSSSSSSSTQRLQALQDLRQVLGNSQTYQDLKQSRLLEARRVAKEIARKDALKGWVRNEGDDDFGLAVSD